VCHCAVEKAIPSIFMAPIHKHSPSPDIVVVGGANLDITASATTALTAGDSTPGVVGYSAGGVARNVAENLARLGHSVELLSAVGDDAFGRTVLADTASAGVGTLFVQALAGQRTATYVSVHGPDSDMVAAVNDMAILAQLTPSLLQQHVGLMRSARSLVLDANLSEAALGFILDLAGMPPIAVDGVSVSKCVRLAPWLARIHTLKVNRMEAQALLARRVATVPDALAAAQALQARGPAQVVVSMGDQGVVTCDALGFAGHHPAPHVVVVNTSGAGDALLAGLVHGNLQAWDLETAVRFGMACARMTLTSSLANHPDLSARAVLEF
jgi:pseudouridine kinase